MYCISLSGLSFAVHMSVLSAYCVFILLHCVSLCSVVFLYSLSATFCLPVLTSGPFFQCEDLLILFVWKILIDLLIGYTLFFNGSTFWLFQRSCFYSFFFHFIAGAKVYTCSSLSFSMQPVLGRVSLLRPSYGN